MSTRAPRARTRWWAASSSALLGTVRSRCSICGCGPMGQVAGGSCSTFWKASAVLPSSRRSTSQSCPRGSGASAPGCSSPGRYWRSSSPTVELREGSDVSGVQDHPAKDRDAGLRAHPYSFVARHVLRMRVRRHRHRSGRRTILNCERTTTQWRAGE